MRAEPATGWKRAIAALALAAVVALTGCRAKETAALPALGADAAGTTVSGLSAGAYMAGQFQLAHSSIVVGAGLIAGGPYACAESLYADAMPGPGTVFLNASKAINGCMLDALRAWDIPNPAKLADRARQLASKGLIDPVERVRDDRIYIFSGTADRIVVPSIVAASVQFYELIGVPRASLLHVGGIAAGHAIATTDKGLSCGETGAPYLNACGYDAVGALLEHVLGPLKPPAPKASGEFVTFDQSRFAVDLEQHSMAATGIAYVPQACRRASGCRVHIAFHGCNQSRAEAGDAFTHDTGYTRWADTNRLIVLFPQIEKSPLNPHGCWDWWGYTGRDYLTRNAPQIAAVKRMLDKLAATGP